MFSNKNEIKNKERIMANWAEARKRHKATVDAAIEANQGGTMTRQRIRAAARAVAKAKRHAT